jgi:hypothetical protein
MRSRNFSERQSKKNKIRKMKFRPCERIQTAANLRQCDPSATSTFTLTFIAFFFLSMASQEMDKPLLLSAILGSKDGIVTIRVFFSD